MMVFCLLLFAWPFSLVEIVTCRVALRHCLASFLAVEEGLRGRLLESEFSFLFVRKLLSSNITSIIYFHQVIL